MKKVITIMLLNNHIIRVGDIVHIAYNNIRTAGRITKLNVNKSEFVIDYSGVMRSHLDTVKVKNVSEYEGEKVTKKLICRALINDDGEIIKPQDKIRMKMKVCEIEDTVYKVSSKKIHFNFTQTSINSIRDIHKIGESINE